MRHGRIGRIYAGLLATVAAAALSGCSVINTVGDGVSGTLGGVTNGISSTTPEEQSAAFVETRFASIRAEAARGEGENLDSLATLLGESDRVDFARFMKQRYADLFAGLQHPRELLARIDRHRSRKAGTLEGA